MAGSENPNELLLQTLGGAAKIGGTYLIDGPGLKVFTKTVDGFVEFAKTGDWSEVLEGAMTGGVYLIPGGREVMLANSGVQLIGQGIGGAVYLGSDWLGGGDPMVADAFRQQSEDFIDAVESMDLTNVIDSTANSIQHLVE